MIYKNYDQCIIEYEKRIDDNSQMIMDLFFSIDKCIINW